ncbi:MAG: DUF2600 family protein [Bacillota bacterium]|jgi:tetraprenyl-beta-curcumene synthase
MDGGDREMSIIGAAEELTVYPQLVFRVFPIVRRELKSWTARARTIPCAELKKQALASLSSKAFHCMGGSVLALGCRGRPANHVSHENRASWKDMVRGIVAVQTVSDYLDNLCDRAQGITAWAGDSSLRAAREGFRTCMQLHEAFRCALDPGRPTGPYYQSYPVSSVGVQAPSGRGDSLDGEYLRSLVDTSRSVLSTLPSYRVVLPAVRTLAQLYSELQSIKHLSPEIRDGLMEEWFRLRWVGDMGIGDCRLPLEPLRPLEGHLSGGTPFPLKWWEFAAATGSTLGMFALACAAITPLGPDDASSLVRAYFPSISALHILLDYYIDREEDEVGGDLNFVSYYSTAAEREAALSKFVQRSMDDASSTADAWLHRAVVRGLLAMYLSDPKARVRDLCPEADALVSLGGCPTRFLRDACGVMRKLLRF